MFVHYGYGRRICDGEQLRVYEKPLPLGARDRNSIYLCLLSGNLRRWIRWDGRQEREPPRFRPLNLYGYSKHLFDLYAQEQRLLPKIVGLKYFNVFGPNEYHKGDMRSLVCKAYDQIVATGKIRLFKSYKPEYADGAQMRDFVYVKDAVAMTLHLAETPAAAGLYNIGAGVARTWNDLANSLFSALNIPAKSSSSKCRKASRINTSITPVQTFRSCARRTMKLPRLVGRCREGLCC